MKLESLQMPRLAEIEKDSLSDTYGKFVEAWSVSEENSTTWNVEDLESVDVWKTYNLEVWEVESLKMDSLKVRPFEKCERSKAWNM